MIPTEISVGGDVLTGPRDLVHGGTESGTSRNTATMTMTTAATTLKMPYDVESGLGDKKVLQNATTATSVSASRGRAENEVAAFRAPRIAPRKQMCRTKKAPLAAGTTCPWIKRCAFPIAAKGLRLRCQARQASALPAMTADMGESHYVGGAVYRAVYEERIRGLGLDQAPCVRCPTFDFCNSGGPVNPQECVYYESWLGTSAL